MKKLIAIWGLLTLLLLLPTAVMAQPLPEKALALLSGVNINLGPNNIVLTGQDAHVPADTQVENVVVVGGNARIAGRVLGEVVSVGGSVYLESTAIVDGTAVAIGGTVELSPGAQLYGEQVSIGLSSLGWLWPRIGSFNLYRWRQGLALGRLLTVVFLGCICYWLLPRPIGRIASTVNANPAKASLLGLLAYLAAIPLTILFILTILGIPLVPVLWLLIVAARFLGQVALGLLAGRWLAPYLKLEVADMALALLGLVVLALISFLPVIGGLASLFYGIVGFGAAIWTRMGTRLPLEIEE